MRIDPESIYIENKRYVSYDAYFSIILEMAQCKGALRQLKDNTDTTLDKVFSIMEGDA